jgi:hypothetical protein
VGTGVEGFLVASTERFCEPAANGSVHLFDLSESYMVAERGGAVQFDAADAGIVDGIGHDEGQINPTARQLDGSETHPGDEGDSCLLGVDAEIPGLGQR